MVRQKHHRYIFWQNIVGPHQVALLEAMTHSGDIEVVLVADTAMCGGWTAPVLHDVKIIIGPTRAAISDLVRGSVGDCVHIVTGFSRGCRVGHLALGELRRSKPAGCLVGVQAEPGDGPLRPALESWAQGSELAGAIHFKGRVSDDTLHTMYSAADAFVLPSQALECFGLIAVESFAAGRPVLATPVGAIPEVVGSICPQWIADGSDGVALSQLIAQFLAGELPLLSPLDLREAARERWDSNLIMPQVEEVLQKAAARSALRQRSGHA